MKGRWKNKVLAKESWYQEAKNNAKLSKTKLKKRIIQKGVPKKEYGGFHSHVHHFHQGGDTDQEDEGQCVGDDINNQVQSEVPGGWINAASKAFSTDLAKVSHD
jgi:hypothetical protein